MSRPLISVVIPCYNRAQSVEEAVKSVLSQDYDSFEVIAVDDHSDDDTMEILKSIQDHRLSVASNPGSRGAGAARNFGINLSKSPWIAFQDSDDIWLPRKLSKQMACVESGEYIGVYCGLIVENSIAPNVQPVRHHPIRRPPGAHRPNGKMPKLDGDISESIIINNLISTQTLIARRGILEQIGGFDELMPALEDWELAIRLSLKGKIAFVDEDLVVQRFSDNSITRSSDKQIRAQIMLLNKHKKLLQRHPKILAYHHHRLAGALRKQGDYKAAYDNALAAWKLCPYAIKYQGHMIYLRARQ